MFIIFVHYSTRPIYDVSMNLFCWPPSVDSFNILPGFLRQPLLSLVFYDNRNVKIFKSKESEQHFRDKIEIFIRLFDEHFAHHFESHWRETWRRTGMRTVQQISLETLPRPPKKLLTFLVHLIGLSNHFLRSFKEANICLTLYWINQWTNCFIEWNDNEMSGQIWAVWWFYLK